MESREGAPDVPETDAHQDFDLSPLTGLSPEKRHIPHFLGMVIWFYGLVVRVAYIELNSAPRPSYPFAKSGIGKFSNSASRIAEIWICCGDHGIDAWSSAIWTLIKCDVPAGLISRLSAKNVFLRSVVIKSMIGKGESSPHQANICLLRHLRLSRSS